MPPPLRGRRVLAAGLSLLLLGPGLVLPVAKWHHHAPASTNACHACDVALSMTPEPPAALPAPVVRPVSVLELPAPPRRPHAEPRAATARGPPSALLAA